MHLIVSTSITRFTVIKQEIRNLKPSSYAGQNIQDLTRDLIEKATELDCAGYYDHTLSLAMVESFLAADGDTTGSFAFEMNHLRRSVDDAIKTTTFMPASDRDKYMLNNKLSFRHICEKASSEYRTLLDDNRWPPAKLPKDSRAVPKAYLTLPDVLTLVQNAVSSNSSDTSSSKTSKVICYKCGEPGHYSRNCTSKAKHNNKPKDTSSFKGDRKTHGWKTTAPKDTESQKKTVNGRDFNWCSKCRRWSTTHGTSTHTGKRPTESKTESTADKSPAVANLTFDPSIWIMHPTLPTESHSPPETPPTSPTAIPWMFIAQWLYIIVTFTIFMTSQFLPNASPNEIISIISSKTIILLQDFHNLAKLYYAPASWVLVGYFLHNLMNLPLPVLTTSDLVSSRMTRKDRRQAKKDNR